MIVELPAPNAFPVGSLVRAGSYSGEVVEQLGPYSVVIRDQRGQQIATTTTDMVLDPTAQRPQPDEPAPPSDLFAFL